MKVKIKTWKQMVKEFGTNECNDIDSFICFTDEMEDLLPESRIIDVVLDEEYTKECGRNVYVWDPVSYCNFYIVDDMIEKVIE